MILEEYGYDNDGWTPDFSEKLNAYAAWWQSIQEDQNIGGELLWQFTDGVKCGESAGNVCPSRDPQITALLKQHGINMDIKSV